MTLWSDWSSCSRTCGEGLMTRTRSCIPGCDSTNEDLVETQNCNEEDCCIEFRNNLQCTGDIAWQTSTESPTLSYTPTLQSPEGYGRCASACIGIEGVIAFNWINRGYLVSTCECLRMVSKFLDYQLLFFFQKTMLHNYITVHY